MAQPYTFLTYREVEDLVMAVASGYARLGVQPKERIGVLAANCPEWMIALQVVGWLGGLQLVMRGGGGAGGLVEWPERGAWGHPAPAGVEARVGQGPGRDWRTTPREGRVMDQRD